MRSSAFASLLLLSTLAIGTELAYADEPPATASPPASASAPSAATPAGPSPETLKKAKENGLKAEVRKGTTVYCWEDANIGSPFKTKKCVGESQLDELISQRQAQRDALNRAGGNYGAGK
jgi:hypothetical protein